MESVIWLLFKKNLSTTILMKRSRRQLSTDMVIHSGIFKNNQITLLPCFTFILKTGVSFYCVSQASFQIQFCFLFFFSLLKILADMYTFFLGRTPNKDTVPFR